MRLKQGMHKLFAVTGLIGIAGALFAGASHLTSATDRTDPIFTRDVLSYTLIEEGNEITVVYDYKGALLPERFHEKEVLEKRTENSYTVYLGETNDATPQYRLIAYSDRVFVEEQGLWYARETGTTDYATFAAFRRSNPIASLFWETAHADTISPFAEAGDGSVVFTNTVTNDWDGTRDATTGTVNNPTATSVKVGAGSTSFLDEPLYFIHRVFLPFDTSAIPSGATIDSAELNVYAVSEIDYDPFDFGTNPDDVHVVRTSQTTHTTLANADYDAIGATRGAPEKNLTMEILTGGYLQFNLNATGLTWIADEADASVCSATAGITCLGLRIGYDFEDIPAVMDGEDSLTISTSEHTGTSQDPYLEVVYTGGGGGGPARVMRLLGDVRLRGVRLLGL